MWEIADHYTKVFKQNIKDLNILDPDLWPKATDHIAQMIAMVKALEKKRVYLQDGRRHIFRHRQVSPPTPISHGSTSRICRRAAALTWETRGASTDFALWKFSPKDKKRQMEWDSPWGKGFPGWHIECSAMSLAYCPQPLDIHCGGQDHVRVHHTNEIAQAEAATGKPFVRYWLHGEFLVLDKGKMAKSSGDFLTLDSVKEAGISPLAYRMFCYSAHYRSPLMFSWDGLKAAGQGLANLKKLDLFGNKEACRRPDAVSRETRSTGFSRPSTTPCATT